MTPLAYRSVTYKLCPTGKDFLHKMIIFNNKNNLPLQYGGSLFAIVQLKQEEILFSPVTTPSNSGITGNPTQKTPLVEEAKKGRRESDRNRGKE